MIQMKYLSIKSDIIFISIFLISHGIGIVSEYHDELWILMNGGYNLNCISVFGVLIGGILVLCGVGLLLKKRLFYHATLILSFSFTIYLVISLVDTFLKYGVLGDRYNFGEIIFPILVLLFFLLSYSYIFIKIRNRIKERAI